MPARGITVVGQAGFEPTTSSSRTKRATKLRHCPYSYLVGARGIEPLTQGPKPCAFPVTPNPRGREGRI